MYKKMMLFFLLLALVLAAFWGWQQLFGTTPPLKQTKFAMDTIIEITAYGDNAGVAESQAFAEVDRLQKVFDRFDKNSEVAEINANAGVRPVKASPDLIICLQRSAELSAKLDNVFDVTIGPLTDLWGIGRKGEFIPTALQIKELLPLVDYNNVIVDRQNGTVYLKNKLMKLDLGGVAKGYTCDKIIEVLKNNKINSALVNAGGDVRVIGKRIDGKPWRIGVQDPRHSDKTIGSLALEKWDTMETSGDYQRYIDVGGQRYSHIINARTGTQPRTLASVTVVGNNSLDCDILSTALFIVGVDKGKTLLKNFPGIEAIFSTTTGEIILTDGLQNLFTENNS